MNAREVGERALDLNNIYSSTDRWELTMLPLSVAALEVRIRFELFIDYLNGYSCQRERERERSTEFHESFGKTNLYHTFIAKQR